MINIDELLNKIDVDKLIEDYGKKEPEHLDADGIPINIGDVLYFAGDKCAFPDRAYTVIGFEEDYGVELKLSNGVLVYDRLDKYTHSRPDSWEQLEIDSMFDQTTYCEQVLNIDTYTTTRGHDFRMMIEDIVRRAKRLAGVDDE